MALTPRQRDHFIRMTRQERLDVIQDSRKQLGVIEMSITRAAATKRVELEARISFCEQLNLADRRR